MSNEGDGPYEKEPIDEQIEGVEKIQGQVYHGKVTSGWN